MSEADSVISQPPLRILSLDGGGYRGLASLEILDRLMNELKREDGSIPKPCEVFDFITGTSTGGLIAMLLGRLRLSVDEARTNYLVFGENIFGPEARISTDPKHYLLTGEEVLNPAPLEAVLDKVAHGMDLLDSHPDRCRVAVLTTEERAVRSDPVFMRSYPCEAQLLPSDKSWSHNWTIKEAGRATSAAPTYFPPLRINDHGVEKSFQDAGVAGFNNPVLKGIAEVRNRIPEFQGRHIGCVVSIGTGLNEILLPRSDTKNPDPFTGSGFFSFLRHPKDTLGTITDRALNLAKYLSAIASDTEDAHRVMSDDPQYKGVYFRANVPGIGKYELDDLKQRDTLQREARNWLDGEGKAFVDSCVKRMKSQTVPCFELKPAAFGKPTCVGRTDIIEELGKTLSSAVISNTEFKPRSVLIQGPLGIGKSTVALQAMSDARVKKAYGDRIVYLRCDGMLDIASLKSKLLAMRKIDGGKATDDEIGQLLSSAPTLVCLDNFEHLWKSPNTTQDALELELSTLARHASLIITARGAPGIRLNVSDDWSPIKLGPLSAIDARKTLLLYAQKPEPADAAQRKALDALIEKSEGLPLSLSLLGHLAGARDFTSILSRLAKEKGVALENYDETRGLGATMRLSIDEDRVRKTPGAIALCYLLALLPDGASPEFLQIDGLLGHDVDVDEAKVRLVERGLAYVEPAYGLLRMLGPLRVFFKQLSPEERKAYGLDLPQLYGVVRDFYFAQAQKRLSDCADNKTRRLLFSQARNIETAVIRDLENPPHDVSAFATIVDAACGVSGWYVWAGVPHASPYLLEALTLAKARGDLVLVSKLLLEIGRDLGDEDGKQQEAIATLTEAYNVSKKYADELMAKGDDISADEKTVFQRLYECAADASKERAQLAASLDDNRAEAWLQDAINAYENLWDEDGRMDTFIILGDIQAKRGEVEAAVSSYEAVLKVATGKDRYRDKEAVVSRSLSNLVADTVEKRKLLERSAVLFDELDKLGAAAESRLALHKLDVLV